jgi:hypothetical protein
MMLLHDLDEWLRPSSPEALSSRSRLIVIIIRLRRDGREELRRDSLST